MDQTWVTAGVATVFSTFTTETRRQTTKYTNRTKDFTEDPFPTINPVKRRGRVKHSTRPYVLNDQLSTISLRVSVVNLKQSKGTAKYSKYAKGIPVPGRRVCSRGLRGSRLSEAICVASPM